MARAIDADRQGFQILRVAFTLVPILAGADKLIELLGIEHILANWHQYLAPRIEEQLPISGHTFMYGVGGIEVIAGIIVALKPRIGGYLVAVWLLAIILNLLLIPDFYDIALRDFGLMLGAVALARLSHAYD